MAGRHREPDDRPTEDREPDGKGATPPKGHVYRSENAQKPAGSDIPHRGEGVTIEDA